MIPQGHPPKPAERAHTAGARQRFESALRELRGLATELTTILSERRLAHPDPPPAGLVIDLGGGHDPFPRSDAVVDKYVADDFERGGAVVRDRPLIVADGEALPFRDHSVAYLIAAHVLEHAPDPQRFAAEMSRVADAGFVQVPSSVAERVFSWPFHPWLVERDVDTLVFVPKPEAERANWAGLHDLYDTSPLFRLAFFAHRSIFHHSLHWRDRIDVQVRGVSRAQRTAQFHLERTIDTLRRCPAPPLTDELRAALRCPLCPGGLCGRSDAFECEGCGRRYPIEGNVPLLIREASDALSPA